MSECCQKKTYELTEDHKLNNQAHDMTQKFQQLNSHYASVHALISHTLPVTEAEVTQAEQCINSYMQFYWEIFENINITPIQHILESHCIPFLRT